MSTHALCALLWIAQAALAAPREPMLPTTTPPIVYTIDYSGPVFSDPHYLDQFKAAPPDLLHIGKALPITHLWGPVRLYNGENQYTGGPNWTLDRENVALLPPEALAERVEHIRQTLARYHAAGIREIAPYISYHALAGDHQQRLGFWAFYDQWDRYAKWAGPRPAHDPFDWLAVDRKGEFLPGSCGGYTPAYFAPLHRYRACINNPDWAEWHRRLVCMAAEVGYDGCFIDNTNPDPCFCPHCKDLFHGWLAAHCDDDWVHRLMKGQAIDKLTLDSQQTSPELIRRWRLLCAAEHLGRLRAAARQIRPDFTIFPNGNSIYDCLTTGSQCDRLMFESSSSPGLLCAGKPPESEKLVVRVVANDVKPERFACSYVLNDPTIGATMKADVSLPTIVQAGKSAKFEVRVVSVGVGPDDNDAAEDFYLLLREAQSGVETRLELQPGGPIGGTGLSHPAKRPPVTLRTAWSPNQPGEYTLQLGLRYTDEKKGPKALRHPYLDPLRASNLCVDHVAELLFTQHMHARTIYLGYEAMQKGWENVQELALAELAAFSGGGGFSGNGRPQAIYRKFFKKHPDLFAGWTPTAAAAVLYSHWGRNPLNHTRPIGEPTIASCLAASHRPFVALVDASLPDRAEELADFNVLYLESSAYEMSAEQLQSLRDYAARGRIVLASQRVSINCQPAVELLGGDRVTIWDPTHPVLPTAAVAPVEGIRKHLRFAVYQKADRLTVHAVNYNVCLLDPHKRVLEVEATPLSVPLPAGWNAVRATCFDPGAVPEELPCTVAAGVARLTLPRLHIYKVVLLERR
jgi:hypothetical protein